MINRSCKVGLLPDGEYERMEGTPETRRFLVFIVSIVVGYFAKAIIELTEIHI